MNKILYKMWLFSLSFLPLLLFIFLFSPNTSYSNAHNRIYIRNNLSHTVKIGYTRIYPGTLHKINYNKRPRKKIQKIRVRLFGPLCQLSVDVNQIKITDTTCPDVYIFTAKPFKDKNNQISIHIQINKKPKNAQ